MDLTNAFYIAGIITFIASWLFMLRMLSFMADIDYRDRDRFGNERAKRTGG